MTAYINEWYERLGEKLSESEAQIPGLPREAVTLLAELWRLAADTTGDSTDTVGSAGHALQVAERAALIAESKALTILNKELRHQSASAERSLVETRALLARREAAQQEDRATIVALEQALAQTRIELEIALERQRLASARTARHRPPARPAKSTRRPPNIKRAIAPKRRAPDVRKKPKPSRRRRRNPQSTSRKRR